MADSPQTFWRLQEREASGQIARRDAKTGLVVVTAEIAHSARARRRGLVGRDGIEGALVLPRCHQVHTFGLRFAIDVAFCAADGEVIRAITLAPRRLSPVVWRSRFVVEAAAGAFADWPLRVGDLVRVRESAGHG